MQRDEKGTNPKGVLSLSSSLGLSGSLCKIIICASQFNYYNNLASTAIEWLKTKGVTAAINGESSNLIFFMNL